MSFSFLSFIRRRRPPLVGFSGLSKPSRKPKQIKSPTYHKSVTVMKLKVDLQCEKCYMKVKKILCKFPQIQDQLYNEKENTVTIKVVCCNPEKVRDKLCCQGGGSIKSIEIVDPPKPEKPKDEPIKPKDEPEKPKDEPNKPKSEPEKPKEPDNKPKDEPEKPKSEPEKPKEPEKPTLQQDVVATPPPSTPPVVKLHEPAIGSVVAYLSPPTDSVGLFYENGPQGFYGRSIYDSYGGSGPCYLGSYHQHLGEEDDASMCTIA